MMMIIPIIVDHIESVMNIHIHVALHLCVCANECGLTVNDIITELLSLHKIELSLSLSLSLCFPTDRELQFSSLRIGNFQLI